MNIFNKYFVIMSDIIIRKATTEDAISLALLARVTFREAFGHLFKDNQNLIDYFAKSFSIKSLTNKIKESNNVFWIALVDNLPIGYAKLLKHSPSKFIKDSKVSELQRIYVLNDFLNQKIGHLLQIALFEEVKKIKSNHLWLSVYVDNPKAIQFYKRYDFNHIGNHYFRIEKESFEFMVLDKVF
jgi:ribosomal protein S18 acetylase RimI-like enzyme